MGINNQLVTEEQHHVGFNGDEYGFNQQNRDSCGDFPGNLTVCELETMARFQMIHLWKTWLVSAMSTYPRLVGECQPGFIGKMGT